MQFFAAPKCGTSIRLTKTCPTGARKSASSLRSWTEESSENPCRLTSAWIAQIDFMIKPRTNHCRIRIYACYQLDLLTSFCEIGLIDTDCIVPRAGPPGRPDGGCPGYEWPLFRQTNWQ